MTTIRKGDRIRLIHMPDDPDPIPAGSTGTIESVTEGPLGQVWVRWDSGRSLALVPGVDRFEVIERGPEPDAPTGPTAVALPRAVYEGIEAARRSGMYNMLDLPAIAGLTRQLGFDEAADWLNDRRNRKTYAEGIFRGFAPEGE
ncbi:DUF4314 domain-containing protein [bacterium]|nr:DUF4314 domain-containing protein [bacterium]